MIKSLDHLIIAVNNLEEAEQNYQKILGIKPSWRGHHKEWGTSNSLFKVLVKVIFSFSEELTMFKSFEPKYIFRTFGCNWRWSRCTAC